MENYALSELFFPLILNSFTLICSVGFILLYKKAQPPLSWLNIARIMFLLYYLFTYIVNIIYYILVYLIYVEEIDIGESYLIIPVMAVIAYIFLFIAGISAAGSFMKIKWAHTKLPLEPRYFLHFNIKKLTLFVLFSFTVSFFFLGIIIAATTLNSIWISVQFFFISFLLYLSFAGSSSISARSASKIITMTLVMQVFLSFTLGIMLSALYFASESSLLYTLNWVIFLIGFTTYLFFPWLIAMLLKNIEGQNIRNVLRFCFWNISIFLILFPETLFICFFLQMGSIIVWPPIILLTIYTAFLCFSFLPISYMLYIKSQYKLRFRVLLEQFSQPLLLLSGWITAAFAMTFFIIYIATILSVLALFYLMIGCGLLLFTFIIPPKALIGINILGSLDLLFLGIFATFINSGIFWIGAVIIITTLLLATIMLCYNIRLIPTPLQIGRSPEPPVQSPQAPPSPTFEPTPPRYYPYYRR